MSNYQGRPRLPSPKIFDIGEISCYLSGEDIDNLIEAGIAVVSHGNGPTHPYADNVMIDEVKAAEEAISYLIDKGHRRIGTIVGPEATWDGRLRKEGYLNSLQAHGFPVDDELICEVDFFRHEVGRLAVFYNLDLAKFTCFSVAGSLRARLPVQLKGKIFGNWAIESDR